MEIFKFFFKFGWIAFGGPAAHIALMQEELVRKRKWLSEQEFLDYMGITNLIPGPNSTEMTMHMGCHRGGVKGLFIAGIAFIFPAVLITLAVAVFYDQIRDIASAQPILTGIKAAVLSFIAGAIIKLGKKAAKSNMLIIVGALAIIACWFGFNEILVILGAGVLGLMIALAKKPDRLSFFAAIPMAILGLALSKTSKIFLIFLKIGSVLFGSGYVLFAYLDGELIDNLGWLTHSDLVEAVAVGQMTPGPVLSTATFIGYQVGGFRGAVASTLGIFLPAFLFVWLLNPIVNKMRSSPPLRSFLDFVNIAAVSVMIYVTYEMTRSIIIDWKAGLIAVVSFAVYFYWKGISPFYIIIGGGILGWLLSII